MLLILSPVITIFQVTKRKRKKLNNAVASKKQIKNDIKQTNIKNNGKEAVAIVVY